MTATVPSDSLALAPWPEVDFESFGPVERTAMGRAQQFVAASLARNWAMIPHVTHHEEADLTALDALRRQHTTESSAPRLSLLAYLIKAAVAALQAYPQFNASLEKDGKTLVLKRYWHIGFAVDTPAGLLVPVVHDADKKSVSTIAAEVERLIGRARGRGLSLGEMSGGCFTISSLGSIGGTAFTPIINAPEVAILGVSRSVQKPVNVDGELQWRNQLPLSLSYDHRVINGADAARFCVELGKALAAPQTLQAADR